MLLEDLRVAIRDFIVDNDDAHAWFHWGSVIEDAEVSPATGSPETDCDEVSKQFLAYLRARGLDGRLVHVRPPKPEPWYSDHWFVVCLVEVGEDSRWCAVDWTARQFYNVHQDVDQWLPRDSIPVPLTFIWPGPYPVQHVTFQEV